MKSSIDEDRIIFSEEEFFIKIKANDILLNFCSYLLVKLFGKYVFSLVIITLKFQWQSQLI